MSTATLADREVETRPAVPAIAVAAEKLSVQFGEGDRATLALSEVDLTIRQGDFVSLIGPSGCGKTTLLRAIADLVQPSSGLLRVNGMTPEAARLARAYGYVFQAPALLPWRTVAQNIMLPLEIMGLRPERRRAEAAHYIELMGLRDFARKFPWQLSGGMQQRVSIARALSFKPSLLLMDEPFGALDEITRDGLNLHMRELWTRTGLTGVFVTHSIPEAVFLSTHIVVMSARPGRIVEVILSDLPRQRSLEDRDTPAFLSVARRVREALHLGYGHVP
ncbi:ABC transporter ATP-binding protein [Acidisoma sp.]|uniref:ABC transporter ATP-binding protein n=1 Tax=Acidisoma sp. TaxID=1872115 RepID=UPI003AFFD592